MVLTVEHKLFGLSYLYQNRETLIKIYSHPRSGTHLIEKFVGINFYPNMNLHLKPIEWGHWSNRKINEGGYAYQKLFANHLFPPKQVNAIKKGIYIVRDPRAVAYSIWKTKNFLNQNDCKLNFSEFLRIKLDWMGSPAMRSVPTWSIAQHWNIHVSSWLNYSKRNNNILIIKYEDLKLKPHLVHRQIEKKFFPIKFLGRKLTIRNNKSLKIVSEATGLLPNEATIDAWKKVFTKEDEIFFVKQITIKSLITHYFYN